MAAKPAVAAALPASADEGNLIAAVETRTAATAVLTKTSVLQAATVHPTSAALAKPRADHYSDIGSMSHNNSHSYSSNSSARR